MWIVAKTKPKQENKAEKNLMNQGYKTSLPLLEIKKFINNKWIMQKEVLFASYIFIDLENTSKLHKINYTYGISRLLISAESGAPYLINPTIINQIRTNLNLYNPLNINSLKKGDNVVVTKGKLSSLKGIFLEKCSKYRSKLLLQFLNNQRIVVVDSQYLQRLYA